MVKKSSIINSIQAGILRELIKQDSLRFAQINVDRVPSDQFSYHLRQLVKVGLVEKSPEQTYRLSARGKSRTIMLYPNENGFIEQGFLAVRIVLSKIENGQRYFLMRKRGGVPYKGVYETPGDKILFGEDVHEAARRAMKANTGLTCDLELKGLRHLKDSFQGEIVQDKYFFVFAARNPRGKLLSSYRISEHVWLTYDEIKSSGLSVHGGLELLDMAMGDNTLKLDERTLIVDNY